MFNCMHICMRMTLLQNICHFRYSTPVHCCKSKMFEACRPNWIWLRVYVTIVMVTIMCSFQWPQSEWQNSTPNLSVSGLMILTYPRFNSEHINARGLLFFMHIRLIIGSIHLPVGEFFQYTWDPWRSGDLFKGISICWKHKEVDWNIVHKNAFW